MVLSIGRTRVHIHPLALLYPLAAVMLGAGQEVLSLLAALAIHEGAHLLAARGLGVGIARLKLTPFGGAMALENPYALSAARLFAVSAAGPLGNALALLAAAALAHWRLMRPAFALGFIPTNLVLMLFNLLPALPLDGGRMAYALLSRRIRREKALAIGLWMGRAVAAGLVLACAGLALKTGRINLSFLFAAVFILASAADERQALSDTRVSTMLGALRTVGRPVPARLWAVGADCPLNEALACARPDGVNLYAVYKDNRLSSITDDRRLLEAILYFSPRTPVEEATGRPPHPGKAS